MSSGILLILAGIWVGSQVLGGSALKRLGIVPSDGPPKAFNVDPKSGVPNTNPDLPLLKDQTGAPY